MDSAPATDITTATRERREPVRLVTDVYLWTVVVFGTLTLLRAVHALLTTAADPGWLIFGVLTVGTGLLTLRMPLIPVTFSMSDTFVCATALLYGPEAATVLIAADACTMSARFDRSQFTARRLFFNVAASALSMALAARVFFVLAHTEPLVTAPGRITALTGPLLVFGGAYFVLNTGFVARIVAFERGESLVRVWRQYCAPLWLTYAAGATTAGLIVLLVYGRRLDLSILILLAPIPLAVYSAFRSGVDRMAEHVGHLRTVNALHLATIETLAQAIDARDQITHDHIRRVQQYAMRLADELGVADDNERRALEAAALLHDMGKIAVPEHILNKPGKLTAAEFEQMKRHASIGADILSSIEFPFPVVPIVRHHHENWDGTGYPAGLAGADIPLGARILSVVDCFDALTSDRPYRARLSAETAIRMIVERSGRMYDPWVVEGFQRIASTLQREEPEPATSSGLAAIVETSRSGAFQAYRAERQTDPEELQRALGLGARLARATQLHDGVMALHEGLFRPADTTLVYYAYEREADALVARYVAGVHARTLTGYTMPIGARLSGRVAAQARGVVNSDAALDLGDLRNALSSMPRFCVSTPVSDADGLLGVLTLYSEAAQPVPREHVVAMEAATALLVPLARP